MSERLTLQPVAPFEATIRPPGSKSLTNRALLLAALAEGRSTLHEPLRAEDTRYMLEALARLGVPIEDDPEANRLTIEGGAGRLPADRAELFLGNAGTATRFLTAACALGPGPCRIDGIERMRQRPIGELVEPLRRLGAQVRYLGRDGFPPLEVRGPLSGGRLTMKPTLSSQFVSALAQVGPALDGGLEIAFDGPLTSAPYVHMTLGLLERFGARIEADPHLAGLRIAPGPLSGIELAIEPDASNASYFLAAAAVVPGSRCTLEGLGRRSVQGDVGVADLLARMGAGLVFGDDFLTVIGPPPGERLQALDADLGPMPDMAQTLAVVALFAEGTTTLRNIGNLRVKETDRLAALERELGKLGARARAEGDALTITPPPGHRLQPAEITTYDDHRMAMAFAVAGLAAGGVTLLDPGCVAKTYPGFFEDLARVSGQAA